MMTPSSPLEQIVAQRVASRREWIELDEPMIKVVIVALADQHFAFPGEGIREILARARVFFVPGCPPSMEGVVNVRGDIETVIRLQTLLRLPESEPGPASAILIARGNGVVSGLRVDRVLDVLDVPRSSILPVPATFPTRWSTLALGVIHREEQPVTLLNLDALLGDYARGLE